MSASLTSQKDLSKIAFLWTQFFSEDQKGSFTQLIANWRFSRELENIETKNTVAKLLEHDLIIEDIIFEFLLDTNIDSLKCRYSQDRDKTRQEFFKAWGVESDDMQYENPKLGQINAKQLAELIGDYTYQSMEPNNFNESSGFHVCKMIVDLLKDDFLKDPSIFKDGYAMTVKSEYLKEDEIKETYREDYKTSMSDQEYDEEYRPQSEQWKNDEINATNGVDVFL
tara:strand:+ start:721 stop:1395 length:675 start_codon:yes stop_codon:yes gene_type:complete